MGSILGLVQTQEYQNKRKEKCTTYLFSQGDNQNQSEIMTIIQTFQEKKLGIQKRFILSFLHYHISFQF